MPSSGLKSGTKGRAGSFFPAPLAPVHCSTSYGNARSPVYITDRAGGSHHWAFAHGDIGLFDVQMSLARAAGNSVAGPFLWLTRGKTHPPPRRRRAGQGAAGAEGEPAAKQSFSKVRACPKPHFGNEERETSG